MLRSRQRGTAAQQHRVATVPPAALLVVVLGLALIGAAHSLWRGHGVAAALHVVIVAIAAWGLLLARRRASRSDRFSAVQAPVDSSSGTPLNSSSQGTNMLTPPEPELQEATFGITTPGPDSPTAPAGLPVVDRLAITGRLSRCSTSTTGRLSLVLPTDTNVTVASVIDVLLTAGHRILDDHRLTDHPLPEVDVTAVDRTGTKPTPTPATGFAVHITNDPAARRSDITIDTHRLPAPEDGPLLIATTLLAGAEHLLNDQDRSFRPFASHR